MKTLILIILLLLITPPAFATSLQFDAVSGAQYYVVYWGQTAGGPYTHSQNVGLETVVSFSELGITAYHDTWYFVVSAYDDSGPSVYSNEIQYDFPASPISGITIAGGVFN